MPRPTVTGSDVQGAAAPTLNPAAGSDLLVAFANENPVPTLTWRSVEMTTIDDEPTFFSDVARTAYTLTPGTGSASLGGVTRNAGLVAFDGVDGGSPIASFGVATGSGTSITATVTVGADQLCVFGLLQSGSSGNTYTAGANTTMHGTGLGNFYGIAMGVATGDVAVTASASGDWELMWVVLNGEAAPAPTASLLTIPMG